MYESVIGLEVHLAVRTDSKLFCGCNADGFGKPPNSCVCPTCLGLPGRAPRLNREAVAKALMFSLALQCERSEERRVGMEWRARGGGDGGVKSAGGWIAPPFADAGGS